MNLLLTPSAALYEINDDIIKDHILSGDNEGFTLELKEDSRNPNFKQCIRETIASIANREGGFLVIGVKDKKDSTDIHSIEERITGSILSNEAAQWFDEICGKDLITPTPHYEVRATHCNGKNIVIVKIYQSHTGPIAIKKDNNSLLEFWIRGNGSNMKMDYIMLNDRFNYSQVGSVRAALMDLAMLHAFIENNSKITIIDHISTLHPSSVVLK